LNNFKDHEVLNAFKLALINFDQSHNPTNDDQFYQNLGEDFITLLRKTPEPPSNELERKLNEMNIHSESHSESARISDFGDIIPVDMDFESGNTRKHQKWSLAEQKKLTSLVNNRNLLVISKEEWDEIATKLDRSYASVLHKAEEIFGKIKNKNKKRNVLENPPATINIESKVQMPLSKNCNDSSPPIQCQDIDSQTDLMKSERSDALLLSRKRAIETVLSKLQNERGTKNQIFDAIIRTYDINLHEKSSAQYKGFHQ
jgi:hypothetical protein